MTTTSNISNFQTRAAGLLYPPASRNGPEPSPTRPDSRQSAVSTSLMMKEKAAEDISSTIDAESPSLSSNEHTLASSKGSAPVQDNAPHVRVRTIPPWVHSIQEEDDDADPTKRLLPRPASALAASHHYMPLQKPGTVPGRRFDHQRERTPALISQPLQMVASKWQAFARASAWGSPEEEDGAELVSEEWMRENMPDLERPWQARDGSADAEKDPGFWLFTPSKRKRWWKKKQRMILRNAMVPLFVRLTIISFSAASLGLAGSIMQRAHTNGCTRGASTFMAVIVNAIAILYSFWITYDEYTSKPLGLRPTGAKLRLVFLDLFFIVFNAADLALASAALSDNRWACRSASLGDNAIGSTMCLFNVYPRMCSLQKGLTAVLLIALVAWLLTFAISMLRLIDKVLVR